MGKSQKRKGYRTEHNLVKMFEKEDIKARRQPLSGALVDFPHDLYVDILGGSVVEVKARANGEGFKTIQRWKGSSDILLLVEDRKTPTVVLNWRYFIDLVVSSREQKNDEQRIHKDIQKDI